MRKITALLLVCLLLCGVAAAEETSDTVAFGNVSFSRDATYIDMGEETVASMDDFIAFLKEFPNLPAELLWVVVAGNQNLIACKWAEVERPLRFLCPDEITDHVHSVIAGYPAVPVIQNGIVHFGKISKGTIIKSNDICMTKMQVCDVVICHCVTVFRDMECQCHYTS